MSGPSDGEQLVRGNAPPRSAPSVVVPAEKTVGAVFGGLIAEIDQEMSVSYSDESDLAAKEASEEIVSQQDSYIAFLLGENTYAAPVFNIAEVLRLERITGVPNVPPWVLGVANLRGEIISVVDLAGFLGLTPTKNITGCVALVSRTKDESMSTCFVVDGLKGMRMIDPSKVDPVPSEGETGVSQFLQGVASTDIGMVSLFDFDSLLLCPSMDFASSPQ